LRSSSHPEHAVPPFLGGTTPAYQERAVIPQLREHFEAVWFQRVPTGTSGLSVIPDGSAEIVWFNGVLRVAGPERQLRFERVRPGSYAIGVRFRPGRALPWLEVPLSQLVDGHCELAALWGDHARALAEWVSEARHPTEIGQRIEQTLLRKLPIIDMPDDLSKAVCQVVSAQRDRSLPITRHLCRSLCISERTLRRRCHELFGYGPKTLERILRFRKFLTLLRSSDDSQIAQLAEEIGYADQSHLSRETHQLAGLTPDQLRRRVTGRARSVCPRMIGTLLAIVLMAFGARPAKALQPNPMHIGMRPVLGWSSWSSFRGNASAAKDEAVARAMVSSGLARLGYRYINQDDGWYVCPGGFGPGGASPSGHGAPTVDRWGFWIPNERFPARGSANGIKALADYLHSLGLKFGIYLTPGISMEAVAKNTPVEGSVAGRLTGKPSGYTARQIATKIPEQNYNCGGSESSAGGMVGLNFSSPGAQLFVSAWADTLASWGVDFLKLDGLRYPSDIPEIKAWSLALRQTGRPIDFDATEGYTVELAPTLEKYATQWEEGEDVECYSCNKGSDNDETFPATDAFPLTIWTDPTEKAALGGGSSKIVSRFNYAAQWQPYAHPGGFNDLDSVEVGNGSHDGISLSARKTVLSLWSLASSPLILGSDLRYLAPEDLALLRNRAVLAVDQDGIAARRIRNTRTEQVFAKREPRGDVIVGLFNTSTTDPEEISIASSAIGLPAGCAAYGLQDLWSNRTARSSGQITANVPPEGVALFRVTPHCAHFQTRLATRKKLPPRIFNRDSGP